ncbi:MAG: AAA family ATPase [Saprospiraceae bacterium]|nr:AAA family ATPase [Saprospiraceae bacterium]
MNKLAKTLGELKKNNYVSQSIQNEIRNNLIKKISNKEKLFEGIFGYDNTVIPDTERALLSGHNILFLGLRGQAKTRMARLMTELLDEFIPIVAGSEINDDPFLPVSKYAKEIIAKSGDQTAIHWIHRSERYIEKLATPDVSIADLLGDIDPIKAASKKIEFSDENAIHFGLIPRSNRSIFVINELPDLQNRIQVALFNILEENDVQIRGFKIKLPLNILLIFTANPEDYTQRGNIITPLKDRIQSQILTHYPESIDLSMQITSQEVKINSDIKNSIEIPPLVLQLIEQLAFSARTSPLVDQKSGVSARLSITVLELLYSAIFRRMLLNNEKKSRARLSDLISIIPALTGKLELVYEGEQLGAYQVALQIIDEALKAIAKERLPKLDLKTKGTNVLYNNTIEWFNKGGLVELAADLSDKDYNKQINTIPINPSLLKNSNTKDIALTTELILHFLSSNNTIQKNWNEERLLFKDPLGGMLNDLNIQ